MMRRELREALQKTFLEQLILTGNVKFSAHAIGVSQMSVYRWRWKDLEFAARWNDAIQQATDAAIKKARRNAVDAVARFILEGRAVPKRKAERERWGV
ncbi:MAG TPA: hypothetical protein VEF34_17980 [Syntrophobacteraceae bacterium]|nr:hypothetical protein [Syntrophobacteraceae bacterium]